MPIRLATLRVARKLTQQQIADHVGVSRKHVSEWETLKQPISSKYIYPLAEILDCHPGELFAEMPDAHAANIARRLSPARRAAWITTGEAMLDDNDSGDGPISTLSSSTPGAIRRIK